MNKVPATVITGFLGAGKTTLIRHLIENAGGRRLALIINEFGDVGVDGALVKGCGDDACPDEDIIELANGCICCTVADDFLPTMRIQWITPPDSGDRIAAPIARPLSDQALGLGFHTAADCLVHSIAAMHLTTLSTSNKTG